MLSTSSLLSLRFPTSCDKTLLYLFLRFPYSWDKHKGNLYTLGVSQYLGTASRMNVSVVQARGDGDWADYVNFFNILNAFVIFSFLFGDLSFVSVRSYL